MELKKAEKMANKVVKLLESCCSKIAIAGSIRRQKPEVKDIEIVCQPIVSLQLPHIDMILSGLQVRKRIRIDKNGKRYKSFTLLSKKDGYDLIKVDLFIVYRPATWGCIFLIRTGPARFSKWIVSHAMPKYRFYRGQLFRSFEAGIAKEKDWQEKPLDTPTEQSVFDFLSLEYITAQERK